VTPEVTQPAAYSYLLGIYLGDGYISRTPKTYRLEVSRHERQTIVIERVGRAIMALRPGHSVGRRRRGAVVIVNAYANLWPQLFPQHGAGRKHLRPIVLERWQQSIVAQHPAEFVVGASSLTVAATDASSTGATTPHTLSPTTRRTFWVSLCGRAV